MDGVCQHRPDTSRALEAVLVAAAQETAAEILNNQATRARFTALINAAIDHALDNLNAHELLREPEFRTEMQQLIRAAFRQTLKELNEG